MICNATLLLFKAEFQIRVRIFSSQHRIGVEPSCSPGFWLKDISSTRVFSQLFDMFARAWILLPLVAATAIPDPDWEAFKHKYQKMPGSM